jgi:hypothetical protein
MPFYFSNPLDLTPMEFDDLQEARKKAAYYIGAEDITGCEVTEIKIYRTTLECTVTKQSIRDAVKRATPIRNFRSEKS